MQRTKSSWAAEALAVFHKEWMTEMRSRHGLFTSFLFSLLAVVAMSFAAYGNPPPPTVAAGMLSVTLLFSSVVALPRSFLAEDEQGTFDLLRMAAEPTAIFAGKWLYNAIQAVIAATILTVVFVAMAGLQIDHPELLALGVAFSALSLAGGVSACGALVMGASNRWLLGAAAALPILLPQVFLSIGAMRAAMGEGSVEGGWQAVVGLLGWAVAIVSGAPMLAEAAWRTDQ